MRLQAGDMFICHYPLYDTLIYLYVKRGAWGHELMNMSNMETYVFDTREIKSFFKNWEQYK